MGDPQIPPVIGDQPPLKRSVSAGWSRRRKKNLSFSPLIWWALPLFKVSGIRIRVHPTFVLLLFYFAYLGFHDEQTGGWVGASIATAVICLAFVCVCLHELGHSLVAQRFGIEVQDITLLPIGGVASLKRIPEDPFQEIAITAAGPLVNLVIAVGIALSLGVSNIGPALIAASTGFSSPRGTLLAINISMFVFNLTPAFPMDGGRLLRAVLAFKLPYVRATTIAATLGQFIAVLFLIYGVLGHGNASLTLSIIGIFIIFMATNEERAVKTRSTLGGVRIRQIMRRTFATLTPSETANDALHKTFQNEQEFFPILDGDHLLGIVTRPQLIGAIRRGDALVPVSEIMERHFQTTHPDEIGASVHERMFATRAAVLPVVEDGRLVGIITAEIFQKYLSLGAAVVAPPPHPADSPTHQ